MTFDEIQKDWEELIAPPSNLFDVLDFKEKLIIASNITPEQEEGIVKHKDLHVYDLEILGLNLKYAAALEESGIDNVFEIVDRYLPQLLGVRYLSKRTVGYVWGTILNLHKFDSAKELFVAMVSPNYGDKKMLKERKYRGIWADDWRL
jgi:hypothetical protein